MFAMKKEKYIKRLAVPLLIFLILLLLVLTCEFAYMTKNAYSNWVVNRFNVQERVYESINSLYARLQILIFLSSLLILSVWGLFRTVRPADRAGRMSSLCRKNGLYLAILFAISFLVLFLMERAAVGRIAAAVETSEVPASLRDRRLHGQLMIGAMLSAEAAVLFLISWIRGRKESGTKQ